MHTNSYLQYSSSATLQMYVKLCSYYTYTRTQLDRFSNLIQYLLVIYSCFMTKDHMWINLSLYLYPVIPLSLETSVFYSRSRKPREVSTLEMHSMGLICTDCTCIRLRCCLCAVLYMCIFLYLCIHVYEELFSKHYIIHYSHSRQVNIMAGSSL